MWDIMPPIMGGSRVGLEGAIAPCRNMLAPHRKVKNYFVGDFWHLQYPESRTLAPSSEESAPLSENSWCHPCPQCLENSTAPGKPHTTLRPGGEQGNIWDQVDLVDFGVLSSKIVGIQALGGISTSFS